VCHDGQESDIGDRLRLAFRISLYLASGHFLKIKARDGRESDIGDRVSLAFRLSLCYSQWSLFEDKAHEEQLCVQCAMMDVNQTLVMDLG
jgi:hypothetical protein